MKRVFLKLIFTFALVAGATSAMAQAYLEDPRYGNTPQERQRNVEIYNLFGDAYNNQDYDKCIDYLQELMRNVPKYGQNLYIRGQVIYRNRIAGATSAEEKNIRIDSLMLIYDMRVEHFGDAAPGAAAVLADKVRDYYTMKSEDYESLIPMFDKAIEAGGDEVQPDIMVSYLKLLSDQYALDNIEAEMILTMYDNLLPILEKGGDEEAKRTFEALFISSGVANCDNLEMVFRPRIEADPSLDNIEKAFASMSRVNCRSDFFFELAEKYHAQKPGAATAMILAARFEEQRDFVRADQYLNDAFSTEEDPVQKSNLLVRMAANKINQNSSREAADLARQAIQTNPENGLAQMILAQAYAAGASACTDFDRRTVYWIVVDYLNQARQMLADDPASLATVNGQISSYSVNFPSQEDCFFRELSNGMSYTVSCGWISGRTTVRVGR